MKTSHPATTDIVSQDTEARAWTHQGRSTTAPELKYEEEEWPMPSNPSDFCPFSGKTAEEKMRRKNKQIVEALFDSEDSAATVYKKEWPILRTSLINLKTPEEFVALRLGKILRPALGGVMEATMRIARNLSQYKLGKLAEDISAITCLVSGSLTDLANDTLKVGEELHQTLSLWHITCEEDDFVRRATFGEWICLGRATNAKEFGIEVARVETLGHNIRDARRLATRLFELLTRVKSEGASLIAEAEEGA